MVRTILFAEILQQLEIDEERFDQLR